MSDELDFLRAENARLLRGDFTEEEFQNLCHKFKESDRKRFCDGCENYHIKLFGSSPITDLREQLQKALECLENKGWFPIKTAPKTAEWCT